MIQSLFPLPCKAKTPRNQVDYSKVSPPAPHSAPTVWLATEKQDVLFLSPISKFRNELSKVTVGGLREETEAGKEGTDGVWRVIWSRLKPEQDGLVTGAYLWRRRRGCETGALWENLLQPNCWKWNVGRSLRNDRSEEGGRGGGDEGRERPWYPGS